MQGFHKGIVLNSYKPENSIKAFHQIMKAFKRSRYLIKLWFQRSLNSRISLRTQQMKLVLKTFSNLCKN